MRYGNPEIRNIDIYAFDDAYAVSGDNFDFQGCHAVFKFEILLICGNPRQQIAYFLYFIDIILIWMPHFIFTVLNIVKVEFLRGCRDRISNYMLNDRPYDN